jgi:hypothetical protein
MITRAIATVVALALGIYAFWGDAMGAGHVLNPFGILFLLLAGLIWFAWGPIREGFKSAKEESEMHAGVLAAFGAGAILRLGSTILKGMGGLKHGERARRRSRS